MALLSHEALERHTRTLTNARTLLESAHWCAYLRPLLEAEIQIRTNTLVDGTSTDDVPSIRAEVRTLRAILARPEQDMRTATTALEAHQRALPAVKPPQQRAP